MQKVRARKQRCFFSLLAGLVFLVSFGAGRILAQTTLEVEPGLKIPNAKTQWAVDVFENQRQLVPILLSTVPVNRYPAANIGGSLAESVSTELDGLNSRNQLHFDRPVLYFWLDERGNVSDVYDFVISQVGQKKEKRVIDRLALKQLTGDAKRTESLVSTQTTAMPDGWMRIEPKTPMPEGEYVLLAIPKVGKATYSPVVWLDFGIHAKAPETKDAIPAASQIKGN